MICQRVNCGREATHAPRICVPCDDDLGLVSTVLSLACCSECFASLTAADFIANGSRGRETLRRALEIKATPFEPEFDRAYLRPLPLSSPEWAEVSAHIRRGLH